MKSLPLGIQTFEEIIKNKHIYVDKTKHIYDLIKQGKCYFLSRPRRFGKSLLCSTLEQVFIGNKELFKSLWIYNSDYDWKPYPVIRFDMSSIPKQTCENFADGLLRAVQKIAKTNKIEYDLNLAPGELLQHIINTLAIKHDTRVVIIVDEYDDPILEHIDNDKMAGEIKEILRNFYKIFKSSDEYIKFVFITGITRFSRVSIFSGLNQLEDITMASRASSLLGYTQNELESYLEQHIKDAAEKRNETVDEVLQLIRHWYNGYRFSKKVLSVYNPFSVMSYLKAVTIDDDPDFTNYWFKTGTPTFLIKLMGKTGSNYAGIEPVRVTQEDLEDFNISTLPIKTILYQAGYLTISEFSRMDQQYTIDFPNYEVRESWKKLILVGVNFDMQERNITGLKHEIL